MIEQSLKLKAKISVIRDNIAVMLKDVLDEDNLANFNSSDSNGYYTLLPEDQSLLKTCKLLLNILTCLEALTESLTNVTAIAQLKESLSKIDLRSLMELQALFKHLYDQCPELFALLQQSYGEGLNQLSSNNTTFLQQLLNSVYASLSKPNPTNENIAKENNFLVIVKSSFNYLKELEQPNTTQPVQANTNTTNLMEQPHATTEWLEKIQETILQAVDTAFTNEEKASFNQVHKGNYQVVAGDSITISNIKHILNGLHGMAKAYHAWSHWTNVNTIATLAHIYTNVRIISDAYYQLIAEKSVQALASSVNRVLSAAIYSMNDLMRDFAIYLDKVEINLGVKSGFIFEQIKPVFQAYQGLAEAAAVRFDTTEGYPYLAARISALDKEKHKINKEIITADIKLRKLAKVNNILLQHNNESLQAYELKELKAIRRNIALYNLSAQDQSDYLKTLDHTIAEKEEQANKEQTETLTEQPSYFGKVNNLLWSSLQKVKGSAEQLSNYVGVSMQSVVIDQVAKETITAQNAKKAIEFQAKVATAHLKVLEIDQQQEAKRLAALGAMSNTKADVMVEINASENVCVNMQPAPVPPANGFRLGLSLLKDAVKAVFSFLSNIIKPNTRELPKFAEANAAAGSTAVANDIAGKEVTALASKRKQNFSEDQINISRKRIKYDDKPWTQFALNEKVAAVEEKIVVNKSSVEFKRS